MESTEYFYELDDQQNPINQQPRPQGYGPNSPDSTLAADGYYRLWVQDAGAQPGLYYTYTPGDPAFNAAESRVERVDSWVEWSAEQKRAYISEQIDSQVRDSSVQGMTIDPGVQTDIVREESAAADKRVELANTADQDLDAFDWTLDVAPPSDGKGYSRLTVDIKPVVAGGSEYSILAVLRVDDIEEDNGAQARLDIIDAPLGSGANALPFAQSTSDPQVWEITPQWLATNFGYKWTDDKSSATVQLRWGAGSTITGLPMTSYGLDDRQAQLVRYGIA